MGRRTHTSIVLECDRCGAIEEFNSDAKVEQSGWRTIPFRVYGQDQTVLCRLDAEKLRRFLQGDKSGVSMRFNDDEQRRWELSCR